MSGLKCRSSGSGAVVARALWILIPVLCTSFLRAPARSFGMGEEKLGNKPVGGQPQWARGVVEAVNLQSRVYSRWVNGNESFYFRGSTERLNEALKRFAAIDVEVREVVILPRRGGTQTFRGNPVASDWELKVPSGIFLAVAKRATETPVYPVLPTLVIFAGSANVDLERLEIPAGVRLLGVEDLVERYLAGLGSADEHTAGGAAHLLGEHVPAVRRIEPLIDCLDHAGDYVRVSAAGALGRFGIRARKALPGLQACEATIREGYRKSVRAAIEAIENGRRVETGAYRRRMKEIEAFLGKARARHSTRDERAVCHGASTESRSK